MDESRDAAYTGDHVLSDTSPNPLLSLSPSADDERTRSLPTYLESLRKLGTLSVSVGYGGHHDTILDLDGRIEEIIAHHYERKARVANLIAELGPTTAHRIMNEMFPELPAAEMFTGMSEVIGNLDLLEAEEKVSITEEEGIMLYDLQNIH